jgi:hypothetical protein
VKHRTWIRRHSLSVAIAGFLVLWLVLYDRSDPNSHWGSFFGNSIADWLGSLVMVVATKFWYERGSAESRIPIHLRRRLPDWAQNHSLTIVVIISWIAWIRWYVDLDPGSRAGEVVGNIVSEWGQMLSLIWFTKYLYERSSKESQSRSI